jgi:hypothetical protein
VVVDVAGQTITVALADLVSLRPVASCR